MPSTYIPKEELEAFIQKAVDDISTELLSGNPYRRDRNRFSRLILDYFNYIYTHAFLEQGEGFHMDYLFDILKQFSEYRHIPMLLLQERFSSLL